MHLYIQLCVPDLIVLQTTDKDAVDAFLKLSKDEGIIPALEPSHALAFSFKMARMMRKEDIIVVTLSGRGDKDVEVVADYLGVEL